MIAKINRKEVERFSPIKAGPNDEPILRGKIIASNEGMYGWNWDLVEYKGKFYVAGNRNFPRTVGIYRAKKMRN